jgi:hypothetical protein
MIEFEGRVAHGGRAFGLGNRPTMSRWLSKNNGFVALPASRARAMKSVTQQLLKITERYKQIAAKAQKLQYIPTLGC